MTPPHHEWTRLIDTEPGRDPRATAIVLVLPHWEDSRVRLRTGVLLPDPAMQATDPIGYAALYAVAASANAKIVAELDVEMGCGTNESPRPGLITDFNRDGVVDSGDFFAFLEVWGREANNGASNR